MDRAATGPGIGVRTAHLVLTNDDGIEAPGLDALRRAAEGLGEVRVIAPAGPWSSMGHAVSAGGEPIRIDRLAERRVAVGGTPADCVRLALHHLAPGPSWVIAGINRGGNLGSDIHHSGTVAAAREAVVRGVPGIAISHYVKRGRPIDWERASGWARGVLELLLGLPRRPGTLWNVNLPHPGPEEPDPDVVFCPIDPSPLLLDFAIEGDEARYTGDYQARPRVPGADVEHCFGGRITISALRVVPDRSDFEGAPAGFPAGSGDEPGASGRIGS